MIDKIKYKNERGILQEFPHNSTLIILPNGVEYYLRWDSLMNGLVITQGYGTGISIHPFDSNRITIISNSTK